MTPPTSPGIGPVALAIVLIAAGRAGAAAPSVVGVEPPSWWVGHSLNPVRLLLRGDGLRGARVLAPGRGLTVGDVRSSDSGHYLFVDLEVDHEAPPGVHRLSVRTSGGSTDVTFEVLPEPRREGRVRGFSQDDVIYLLMPDRFADGDPGNDDPPRSRGLLDRRKGRFYHGGDLLGIRERLPYLRDLGVTTLWITPVYDNNDALNERERYDDAPVTDYHGYGAVDFYAVEEHFGDMATLQDLVDAAHSVGLKVIQDQVANHTGPYHVWARDPPTPTWLNGTEKTHLANPWQAWTLMDPHASPDLRRGTLEGWFIDLLPDLNQDDPEVRRYLIQNALWWVGMAGFDGIRQDTLPYVPRGFWRDWSAALKREHPDLRILGEVFDGDPALVASFQGAVSETGADTGADTGVDSLFDFPLFYAVRRAFAAGGSLRALASVLAHDRLYPDARSLVVFLGLHDVPRFMNEPGASIAGLKQAFTFLATTRGIPLVYYGDEIAMPGGADPDNRRDLPGGWPGDTRSAFTGQGLDPEQSAVLAHVRKVLALRAAHAALRHGSLVQILAEDRAYAFARRTGDETLVVVMSETPGAATVEIPVGSLGLATGTALTDLLGVASDCVVSGGRLRVPLPPRGTAILRAESQGR
jgi:glycosidase